MQTNNNMNATIINYKYKLNSTLSMQAREEINNEALNLLANAEELKLIRSESSKFLKKLAENPSLVKDILDIGLRPTAFQKEKGCHLTADMPAIAIDTLVNLYEDFIDLLAFDRILPKDRSLEGLEMQEEDSPQSNQQQQQPPKEEFQLLLHIHQGIMQGQPEETAYYYLCRLISPLCYQRPVQLMHFYQQHPSIMTAILEKMDQRGLAELFCKILECQSGKQFFKEYKDQYLAIYFCRLQKALSQEGHQEWLEGLQQLYRFLTEKMDEGSDANKYLNLLKTINDLDLNILKEVSRSIPTIKEDSFMHCLRWMQEMLKHDSYIMGQTNIRLSLTYMNRKNSISNNFYKDDYRSDNKRNYHISKEHLVEVLTICQKAYQKYIIKQQRMINIQIAVGIYRVLYFFTRIWNLKGKEKQLVGQTDLITHLINQKFFDRTLETVMSHPRSTILHNCVKQLIIQCLRQGFLSPRYFYKQESLYLQLFLNSFPRNKENIGTPFSQQLYHIYKELIVTQPHVNVQVQNRVLEQNQRMSKLIGGDPRKLHADSLRGSSNAFSESSQNLEDILQFDLHSQHSLSGSNKSCGMGIVKVHNSSSIERSGLQQVGQERIVIEGAEEEDD